MGFTKNNQYNLLEYLVEEEDLKRYRLKTGLREDDDVMLHDFLKDGIGLSTNQIRDFKRYKVLKVNGLRMSLSANVRVGDKIGAEFIEPDHMILPQNIDVRICYEDIDVVCVNKDKEMVSHPTKGHPEHTMSNALRYYGLSKGEDYKPRLINRLDMNTTGIIVFGKNPHAQHFISEQMRDNSIKKTYLAIVEGKLPHKEGVVDNFIYKTDDGIKRAVSDFEEGKRCITRYRVIEEYDACSLVELDLITGRTHQIRVHMSFLGNPIVGDFLYGANEKFAQRYDINRQLLHSHKMFFRSPRAGEVCVSADLPDDMRRMLEKAAQRD